MEYNLGPYFIALHYHVHSNNHVMRFSVEPAPGHAIGMEPSLVSQSDVTYLADDAIGDFVDLLRPLFDNLSGFDRYVVYYQPSPSEPPAWMYESAFVAKSGTAVGDARLGSQVVLTYRTRQGHKWRLTLMEQAFIDVDQVITPVSIAADVYLAALDGWLTGGDGVVKARDNSYPLSPIRGLSKLNDHYRQLLLGL